MVVVRLLMLVLENGTQICISHPAGYLTVNGLVSYYIS